MVDGIVSLSLEVSEGVLLKIYRILSAYIDVPYGIKTTGTTGIIILYIYYIIIILYNIYYIIIYNTFILQSEKRNPV